MGSKALARAAVVAVLCTAVAGHVVSAQNIYGSLVGNVTDSSGASIPGATVTATQTETNLTREVVTNEAGAYTIPNIPSGTYQVVVTVPGFQNFTAREVIVTNRDVRVDARLSLGALEEAVTVTATAAILQTENAAVQHIANAEQLQTLPTSGRAFQSFMTLMPGVADPNYQQSGGINNPGRTMSLTVNGQPATNTVVRLDGITATNQFFESIQSYGPALEAIETVNVVTSSFDADQGMAGAAAVNVQVKTGTNIFRGSAFEYVTDARMRARNYFLPAGQTKGTSSVNVFGGTIGGPIVKNKLFFFFSDESTIQRTFNGNAQGQTGHQRSDLASDRSAATGRFLGQRHGHLRSAHREPDDRRWPRAVCVRQLSGAQLDDRPALRVVQLHSAEPHQPDCGEHAQPAHSAHASGRSK